MFSPCMLGRFIEPKIFEELRKDLAKEWFAVMVFHNVNYDYKRPLSEFIMPTNVNGLVEAGLFGVIPLSHDQFNDLCSDMKEILRHLIDKEGEDALVKEVFNLTRISTPKQAYTECVNLIYSLNKKYEGLKPKDSPIVYTRRTKVLESTDISVDRTPLQESWDAVVKSDANLVIKNPCMEILL